MYILNLVYTLDIFCEGMLWTFLIISMKWNYTNKRISQSAFAAYDKNLEQVGTTFSNF